MSWQEVSGALAHRSTEFIPRVSSVVSSGWRVPGEGDHDNNPGFEAVYKDVDALCPWAVGKARDIESVDWYAAEVKEDVKTVRGWNQATAGRRRVDYIPVVFPGLSVSLECPCHAGTI